MSGLVSTIENILDPVIPWYLSFSEAEASPSVRWLRNADSFIGVLIRLALSRWNFARTFSIYTDWESFIVFCLRSRSTFSPISTKENAAVSSTLTLSIIPLSFGAIILISSTKTLSTGPFRPAADTNMLWSAWIRIKPSFARKNAQNLSYQRREST